MPSMPCYRMPLFREKEKMQTEKVRIDEVLEKEYKLTSWDHDIFHKVMEHWDGIAKPLDGMGQFEPMLAKIGAIQGLTWDAYLSFARITALLRRGSASPHRK